MAYPERYQREVRNSMKQYLKILLDEIMFITFLYLMSYQLVRGLMNHAVLGIVLFLLFIVHQILNLRWYRTLFRGKYPFKRFIFVATDILLLVALAVILVSSVMMSSGVFPLFNIPMTQFGRDIHVCSTVWSFLLMAFHLGLHTHSLLEKLRQKVQRTGFQYAYYLMIFLLLGAGVDCFIKSRLWSDMLLLNIQKSHPPNLLLFYAEYTSIIMSICLLTHFFFSVLDRRKAGNSNSRKEHSQRLFSVEYPWTNNRL